jgi:hypothetical protein
MEDIVTSVIAEIDDTKSFIFLSLQPQHSLLPFLDMIVSRRWVDFL